MRSGTDRERDEAAAEPDESERLRAELRRLELVISSVADGFLVIDRQGKVVRMNPAAREIYRAILGPDNLDHALATTPLDQLFERRDHDGRPIARSDLPIWRALARGEVVPGQELRISTGHGRGRTIIGSAAPLRDERGNLVGAVAVIQDITALKEAERIRDELLSMISHELRTPLTNIKAAVGSLLRAEADWDEASRRDFLQIAEEEADKLSELIERLLDASALRAGALRVHQEPVLLQRVAAGVADRARIRAPERSIRVRFRPDFPAVLADPRRIEQVLQNLVDNALRCSPTESEVVLSGRAAGDGVVTSVADRGIGIRSEERRLIFEPFYQAAGGPGRRSGGSGLGLAICRAIVEAHDGELRADPRRGGGTVFRFGLRLAPSSPNEGAE